MSKIVIGVLSGVFVGAAVYELVKRTNPELLKRVGDFACNKIDELSGINYEAVEAR